MALSASTIWEFNASSTANMVNGGGFNTANAGMLTDLTTDANTANTDSPIVSSASYNFVAGDVGNWVYIKSGTNWTPGFYQIASVATNKATLSAAIGQAVQLNSSTNYYGANTVAGCATVGTPTGGTFSIDYSQSTAAVVNGVADFNAAGASTTLTSATAAFTPVMVGNIFHQTSTGTGGFGVVGWYEIATYVNATTVTLDRTPNSGTASVDTTGYIGGSLSLNSTLDDDFLEIVLAGNTIYFKNGAYTLGEAVTITAAPGSGTSRIKIIGYNSIRGDAPTGTNRPSVACAANAFSLNQQTTLENMSFTVTSSNGVVGGVANLIKNCKFLNTSTTAARISLTISQASHVIKNEFTSQNGIGLNASSFQAGILFNYFHDSDIGFQQGSNAIPTAFNIFARNKTANLSITTADARTTLLSNTFFGAVNTPVGIGIRTTASTGYSVGIFDNIIYGQATGISIATVKQDSIVEDHNDFYNNTTNRTNIDTGANSIAVDPSFTDAAELTGSTATTSGSVLTQSGGDFSTVEDNVDYLRVVSGTGVTTGIYLITSHTGTTLTVNNALGTSSAGNVVWVVGTGSNYGVGTGIKATGHPGAVQGSASTGYLDIGAIQRQEAASGGGGSYTFVG